MASITSSSFQRQPKPVEALGGRTVINICLHCGYVSSPCTSKASRTGLWRQKAHAWPMPSPMCTCPPRHAPNCPSEAQAPWLGRPDALPGIVTLHFLCGWPATALESTCLYVAAGRTFATGPVAGAPQAYSLLVVGSCCPTELSGFADGAALQWLAICSECLSSPS